MTLLLFLLLLGACSGWSYERGVSRALGEALAEREHEAQTWADRYTALSQGLEKRR